MGLFQPNYNKPGKGVDESAPEKRSFFRFWELFGRKFGKLVRVNLLYMLALIPVFLIYLFLAGMCTSAVLSMDSVRGSIASVAEQMASSMNMSPADLDAELCITLDGILRIVLAFLLITLWGAGPATAGATYIWRNFAREDHAWIWSDFKDSFKVNFKQSMVVLGIDLIAFVLFCTSIRVYGAMQGVFAILQYLVIVVAFIYTLMHFYLYPIMVTFELSLKDLYKNSLIFALGKLPSNILVIVVLAMVQLIPLFLIANFIGDYFILFLIVALGLESVILLSFSGFLVSFNASYKIRKHMIPKVEKTEE